MTEHRPEFLRPNEAAARLGVTTPTLARWAAQGRLTATRDGGGMRRYREREIALLVDVQCWQTIADDSTTTIRNVTRDLLRAKIEKERLAAAVVALQGLLATDAPSRTELTAAQRALEQAAHDLGRLRRELARARDDATQLRAALADAERARDYLAGANLRLQQAAS